MGTPEGEDGGGETGHNVYHSDHDHYSTCIRTCAAPAVTAIQVVPTSALDSTHPKWLLEGFVIVVVGTERRTSCGKSGVTAPY